MFPSQKIVTVCDKCLTESCVNGIARCDEAKTGSTGTITDTEENMSKLEPSVLERSAVEIESTEVERNRKLLFCIKTLRAVQADLAYISLDKPVRDMIEEAATPIGGWEAGAARLNAFMKGGTEDV